MRIMFLRHLRAGVVALAVLGAGFVGHVRASELTFEFNNPSFGGDPFVSAHLLALADIQNKHRAEPDLSFSTGLGGESSQAQAFVRQLESRLLSALAGQVTEAIFGENPQDSGTVVFGDQTISFQRGLEFISISIVDASSGTTTDVQVPVLQVN